MTKFIEHFQMRGYRFIALNDLPAFLESSDSGPVMILTFDDGYRDNLDFAFPICEAAGIPMAVYVTSGLIDRTFDPWWHSLQSLIMGRECVFTGEPSDGDGLRTTTQDEKERAYQLIYKKVRDAEATRQQTLEQIWRSNDLNGPPENCDLVMTWDELRQLNESPLVTIGAHTVNHPRLIRCGDDVIKRELVESNIRINEELGFTPIHLAYPFGSENDIPVGISDIANTVGYETAVTTIPRNLEKGDKGLLFTLPRKFISDAINDLNDQEWRIGGMSVLFDSNRRERLKSVSGFK
ncbi:polysaccharide deacetylase family protein [Verrucomicrobiales bacterium]|nr:polysaccharide deacetylase family protein [Verrucomicrobiales bacterium]